MKRRLCSALMAVVLVVAMLPTAAVTAFAQGQMRASEKVIALIKEFEGFHATAYVSGGTWSIGYGTSAKPGDTITQSQADQALRTHLSSVEDSINRFMEKNNLTLSQNQFDALASFSYNCGIAWMNQEGRFRSAVVEGASEEAFLFAISLWANDGSVPDPGLLKRRLAEADMYWNGVYQKRSDRYTYTIFDPNGGTPGSSGEDKMQGYQKDGQTSILVKEPSLNGYTFAGWFTERNGGTQVASLGSATGTKTLYAHYKSNGDSQWVSTPQQVSGSDGNETVLDTGTVTCSTYVNVRKGAGTGNAIVAKLANGSRVNIYQTTTVGSYRWGRLSNGWICLDYVELDGSLDGSSWEDSDSTTDQTTFTGTVNTANLNVRSGPGTGYGRVGSLGYGQTVTVYERTTGYGAQWGRIGTNRWVCMDYVTLEGQEPQPDTDSGDGNTTQYDTARVTGAALLNVRSGPGTGYGRISTLSMGTAIRIYETKTVSGSQWGRIGTNQWVCMTYVTLDEEETDDRSGETGSGRVISKTSLNIRSGAGIGNSLVGRYAPGTQVEILEQTKVSGAWWGRTDRGWVCMDYIQMDTSL